MLDLCKLLYVSRVTLAEVDHLVVDLLLGAN